MLFYLFIINFSKGKLKCFKCLPYMSCVKIEFNNSFLIFIPNIQNRSYESFFFSVYTLIRHFSSWLVLFSRFFLNPFFNIFPLMFSQHLYTLIIFYGVFLQAIIKNLYFFHVLEHHHLQTTTNQGRII